jgi:hypothetical protein
VKGTRSSVRRRKMASCLPRASPTRIVCAQDDVKMGQGTFSAPNTVVVGFPEMPHVEVQVAVNDVGGTWKTDGFTCPEQRSSARQQQQVGDLSQARGAAHVDVEGFAHCRGDLPPLSTHAHPQAAALAAVRVGRWPLRERHRRR